MIVSSTTYADGDVCLYVETCQEREIGLGGVETRVIHEVIIKDSERDVFVGTLGELIERIEAKTIERDEIYAILKKIGWPRAAEDLRLYLGNAGGTYRKTGGERWPQ